MKSKKALPSGRAIDLVNPSTYEFTVEEIGYLLSHINRFNGLGMSVAKHSVMVADTLYQLTKNPHIALLGLLHDSAEAYIGDIGTPVKAVLGESIEKLESSIYNEIVRQLGVMNQYNLAVQPLIKLVDTMALHYELNDLFAAELYAPNELWDSTLAVKISPAMTANNPRSFVEAYDYYRSVPEGDYIEVEYPSLQGKHRCYAMSVSHNLGWLYD